MMQQTFNDILFNVTQNGEKKELKTVNKTSFFEKNQTDNSSNLLTSPILTNNYFSSNLKKQLKPLSTTVFKKLINQKLNIWLIISYTT